MLIFASQGEKLDGDIVTHESFSCLQEAMILSNEELISIFHT